MISRTKEFCRQSIRNKLVVVLPLVTGLFLLFPSILGIFSLRKQIQDYLVPVGLSMDAVEKLMLQETATLVLINLLAIVALAVLVSLIAFGIVHPITELARETENMAAGKRELKPLSYEGPDEVGTLAKSINHFIATIDKMEEEKSRDAALVAIGRMSAELAHELRNPIGAIDLFVQLFPEKWNEENFRASFNKNVTYELSRVKHLLNELLEIARPVKLDFKEISLTDVLEKATQNYKNGNHAGLKLAVEAHCPDKKILADEFALLRVFQNLIQNAAQAMKNNGAITIGLKESVDETKKAKGVEMYFKDTGPGMEEEVLNRIFEPFFSNKKGGTGLGLAICRKIIQGHGGTIHAESRLGTGTTFFLKLPQNPTVVL